MKHFFYLLIFVSFNVVAQDNPLVGIMPLDNGEVVYTGVVPVEGVTKDELFNRAKRWVTLTYKSANDVIQLSDKVEGSLIMKGSLLVPIQYNLTTKTNGYVKHTLTIDMKDGRYRYALNGLTIYVEQPKGAPAFGQSEYSPVEFTERTFLKKSSLKSLTDMDARIKALLADLEKAMKTNKADF